MGMDYPTAPTTLLCIPAMARKNTFLILQRLLVKLGILRNMNVNCTCNQPWHPRILPLVAAWTFPYISNDMCSLAFQELKVDGFF